MENSGKGPLAWVTQNGIVTENQQRLEFRDHRFLMQLYSDMHPDLVVKKSAQVGESVERILKTFYCNKYLDANVIYVLPTNNVVKDFVTPKVNPLISSNPVIQQMVSKDSESLKQIGNRFTYFKGAFSERDAIAISGDILVLDELDRMPDMGVVNTYDSRLQASRLGWRWRLSNPSQVGFGVDGLFQNSDQMHWFMKCHHCGHSWYINFAKIDGEHNHYLDQDRVMYVCGKCERELSDADRRSGQWVAKHPTRSRRGYWISQLIAPWVTAERIMEQKEESTVDFFYNFVLGLAYTPSDLIVNRETILRACAPSRIPEVGVVMGVDQNVNEQIWVAGNSQGIFAHGRTKSWEELEHLKLTWNAMVVCDPAPYNTMPKQLASKYPDFYMCRFKTFNGYESVEWKNHDVWVDRTRMLDTVANEITAARLLFREHPMALEDYIADWSNIYRTTEEKDDGRMITTWKKKENKESDFSLATGYFRVGLGRLLGGGQSQFIEQSISPEGILTDEIVGGVQQTSLGDIVDSTLNDLE